MITEIIQYRFPCGQVPVTAGDTLNVDVLGKRVLIEEAILTAVWDRTISFKYNGEKQWMPGNQQTYDRLKKRQRNRDYVLTVRDRHDMMYGVTTHDEASLDAVNEFHRQRAKASRMVPTSPTG